MVYPVWDSAMTWVAEGRGRAAASRASTETPAKVTPTFDQVVTQWMSPA